MRTLAATLAVVAVASAVAAAAEAPPPLPAYVALPAGYSLEQVTDYQRYQWEEVAWPDPATHNFVRQVVKGRKWQVRLRGVPTSATPEAFAAPLAAAGWTVLRGHAGGTCAHYTKDGHDTWFQASLRYGFRLVETADFEHLRLAAPSATPEPIAQNELPPWLSAFREFTLAAWQRDDVGAMEVTNNVLKEVRRAGPPWVDVRFNGPREIGQLEEQEAYVEALVAAGWDILSTGMGGTTIAHYAKQGRDLWLRMVPAAGSYRLQFADVGAAAAAAALKKKLDEEGHVALYGIYFDVDKATLRPEAEATLRQIQSLLAKYADLKLEIQGHTDDTGGHDHNQKLSEARAASVKAWLAGHAVDGARLATAGFAETKPVAPNTTEEGRQRNRRVELVKK